MLLKRAATKLLLEKAAHYPVVAITGPKQSGKSTLAKHLFQTKPYCSLEDLDHRQFAQDDPRRFLSQYPDGAILDEVQHCPHLFSYIQTKVDEKQQMGMFILTSSQQFGFMKKITQSLAGRAGFIQLLPFSLEELQAGHTFPPSIEALMFAGGYPPIYDRKIAPPMWLSDYILAYLERDVRQLINVQNLATFKRFLQMCAARTGQILNLSSLANDCGITHNTAKSWISVLEASYILFLIQPHHKNFNKRLIKAPKLYFYDTGLVCTLLSVENEKQLITSPIRGALFETWVISELVKAHFNYGLNTNLYFWRDSQQHEVDILIDQGTNVIPVEIKSGQTITSDYFSDLRYWLALSKEESKGWLVYGGEQEQNREHINVIGWKALDRLINAIKAE